MKIAITGHRPSKLGNDYDLTSPLILAIRARLIQYIVRSTSNPEHLRLITGMALGIDTLFAEIAISLKIPFIAAIPCWNQDIKWPVKSRNKYAEIVNNPLCTRKFIHDGYYTNNCMQQRNEWMVNECDMLIAVFDGSPGGTANCVKYAIDQGKEIITIDPKQIKV